MDDKSLGKFLSGDVPAYMAADRKACPLNGRFGVSISRHGLTETPLPLIGRFAVFGIRKGNAGTQWRSVARAGLPHDRMQGMRSRAKEAGKDVKFATKQFKGEIDEVPAGYARGIEDAACREALPLLTAFRAGGTARIVPDALTAPA